MNNLSSSLFQVSDLTINPAPRIPVAVVLDTSSSMYGLPIQEENKGLAQFFQDVRNDEAAQLSAEAAVVSFDSDVHVLSDFVGVADYEKVPVLSAWGQTCMGEGVTKALELLESRKSQYRSSGVDYYQPIMVLMTDGYPNGDPDLLKESQRRVREMVNSNKMTVITVGIGDGADMETLRQFSPKLPPMKLNSLDFCQFFRWLSQSVSVISQSNVGDNMTLDLSNTMNFSTLM